MRPYLPLFRLIYLSVFLSFFTNYVLSQQALNIKNFAIFGGDSAASLIDSLNYGVELASNISVGGGGAIGSQTFVRIGNQVTVGGDIFGNTVALGNSFHLNGGSVSVLNRQNVSYNILTAGPLAQFQNPGNLFINGNSLIDSSGSVSGSVRHPQGYLYNGPLPGGGQFFSLPAFPQKPVLPTPTTFPFGEGPDILTDQTITPGIYGSMFPRQQGGLQITFSGVGTYVLSSVDITSSQGTTFILDFKNNTTGTINIFVRNNIYLNAINVRIINGGSASRVYTEVHGGSGFTVNASGQTTSNWQGTVYATEGSIKIGNFGGVNIFNGCAWSPIKVTVGVNTAFTYVPLSPSANPAPNSIIFPYYPPPADGKVNTLIGSELSSLVDNPGAFQNDSIIYQIKHDSVLIEVISLKGRYAATLAFLQANGLTDTVNNGPGSLVITGKFPIAKLPFLNDSSLIDYVRPLYHPISNSGIVTSQGDTAMRSNLVKQGYNLTGQGVKVGVISDSYNTREVTPGTSGDYAAIDVSNGDLPGGANGVQLVGEYPNGPRSDEGRAMLQIVHDVAPGAQLAFRTGFVSAGDFAQGIGELRGAGCNIIVDDVTYITEPFYKDGVVAQAVDHAVANGVTYFSAAGNFGKQSYEATFKEMQAPVNIKAIAPLAHDFGDENPFQTLELTPGNYTIVLQWKDDIYSLGTRTSASGTQTDLDIFLVDNAGGTLFGFNRNNIGTDPLEVLPFTVDDTTTARLIVAKAAGPNVKFKLIVFRGRLAFTGYGGSSTLVGQANSSGAIAVGAVLYSNTPPYNVSPPTIASFSSIGGAEVNNTIRNKPELTAPNGINTTVDFDSYDLEDDDLPNFYGTSAAAPHAAAAAALLIEGKKKFLGQTITPAQLRTLLQTTAIDMGASGYDAETGYGFVNPFAAMQTFANPIPIIDSLETTDELTMPVTESFTVTVKGKGITHGTVVYFRGAPLATVFINTETVTAVIPPFTGNPPVQLFNPSIISAATLNAVAVDGGFSESRYFFPDKKRVVITADNKTKKYGQKLPVFTSTITVDGVPIQNASLTRADLKLDHLMYTTTATSASNVFPAYVIHPVDPLDPALPADSALAAHYIYVFVDGRLAVEKLPLKITPRDTTLTYGDKIQGINFKYQFGDAPDIQNRDSLKNAISISHGAFLIDSLFALVNGGSGATRRALVNGDLENLSILVSGGSGATRRALVNGGSGTNETSYIIDIDSESIFNYEEDSASAPLVSGGSGATRRALVNTGALINGTAGVFVNGGSGATRRALVNGDPSLINANTTGGASNTNVAVIVSAEDVPDADNNIITTRAINMLTGISAGTQTIVPGAFLSENFEITYGLGKLTIKRAPLTVKANQVSTDNGILPPFTSAITGYQYQDADATPKSGPAYTISPPYTGEPGVYVLKPSAFSFPGDSNYRKIYINGDVTVKPYIPEVAGFTLINAASGADIETIFEDTVIDIRSLPEHLNIRANTIPGKIGSVVFFLDGQFQQTENFAPYSIGGNVDGDYLNWHLPLGAHTLTAIPYLDENGVGSPGKSLTIHFTVVANTATSFVIVNAATDTDVQTIFEDTIIDISTLPAQLNIRANTSPDKIGSVVFILDGQFQQTENFAPYSIGGNTNGDYSSWNLPLGAHTLTAIPYANTNGTGSPGKSLTVHFTVVANEVEGFTLVDAATDMDIQTIAEGSLLDINTLPSATELNVRANTTPGEVGSVVFFLDGKFAQTENFAPYSIGGNLDGDYRYWTLPPGDHTLTAVPYANKGGIGSPGKSLTIHFTVKALALARLSSQQRSGAGENTVSIKETNPAIINVGIYPNPAIDKLIVTSGTALEKNKNIFVQDVSGRTYRVAITKNYSRSIELNVSTLQKGVYFIKIKQGDRFKTLSFIKL